MDTETVTVTGNGSYTTPTGYTLATTGTVTGTYQWDSTYNGDGNNKSVSDNNDCNEQVKVSAACPTITTTPNPTVVKQGTAVCLIDTATLSGGYHETGKITFTLYYGSKKLDTETVTVNGDGTYTTPNGYPLPSNAAAGVYQWDATYSGDGNNNSVSDNNDSTEQVTVVTPCCNLTNVTYYDNHNGKTNKYSDLRGNTQRGDSVWVSFTVPSGDYDQITLVSYTAAQSSFSAASAYLQQIYQSETAIYGPGTYTISAIKLPSSYYQVDFVCGAAIAQLGLSPNDFYSAQNRLISADNGGTNSRAACRIRPWAPSRPRRRRSGLTPTQGRR